MYSKNCHVIKSSLASLLLPVQLLACSTCPQLLARLARSCLLDAAVFARSCLLDAAVYGLTQERRAKSMAANRCRHRCLSLTGMHFAFVIDCFHLL